MQKARVYKKHTLIILEEKHQSMRWDKTRKCAAFTAKLQVQF